jgi:replicative DNA helicase
MNAHDIHAVPWDENAEQGVLGAILFDNRAWDRVADIISDADFYSQVHRDAFAAIGRLIMSGRVADIITVGSELARGATTDGGGLAYLNALAQSVPSAANVRSYAETVRECAARRSLIATLGEAMQSARERPDVGGAVDEITSKLAQLQLGRLTSAPRSISEIAIERVEHYEALQRGTVAAGWPTRISALDARLNGGLRAGSLYILAARPSVGKSSLAQYLGLSLAGDGLPTLFLSMEMGSSEVADRAVSSSGRVSYSALLTGKMEHDHWSRATDAMESLCRLPFHVDDEPALTLRAIRTKAKSIRGLRVLIVDYLQLCASRRRDGNRNSEIEEISRGLKGLAKELGIAVIALSQLNRDVEKRHNRRPTLSDLRDSGAIEQDADVVLFLWPVREFEPEGRKILGLGIDKNRQGRLGEIGLDFFGDTQRWEQSTADIRPEPVSRGRGGDL